MPSRHSLTRRRALAALGTIGAGALLGACGDDEPGAAATPVTTSTGESATVPTRTTSTELGKLFDASARCSVTPEQTEGPYYFEVDRIRSDIREDRKGTRLELALRVRDSGCEPISDAVVEIWHCDAGGVYSGFDAGEGETYLRGAQVTNADGVVRFVTVYPGWYPGRTVHIHAMVLIDNETELTTQLYFDDAASAKVHAAGPYRAHAGRAPFNDDDGIFLEETLLTLRERDDGWLGLMTIDLD